MGSGHLTLRTIYSDHIDNDILKGIEVNSREELMQIAEEEGLRDPIRWDKWDALVEKTKQELDNYKRKTYKHSKFGTPIYAYDINTGELIKVFASAKQAGEHFNTSSYAILYYTKVPKPFNNEVIFSLKPLEKEQLANYQPKWIYAFKLDTGELLGRFKTAVEASRHFGFQTTRVGYILSQQGGKYLSQNLFFSYNKNDRPIM